MASVSEIPRGRATQRMLSFAAYAVGPVAMLGMWGLRNWHLIADHSMGVYAVLLGIVWTGNVSATFLLRKHPDSTAVLHVRVAASALTTAVFVYAAGWGSVLAIAFALGSAELLRAVGPRTNHLNLGWNCLAIALGEAAVALGWAPTLIPAPLAHAVALTGAMLLAVVTKLLGDATTATERAEDLVRERAEHFEALIAHASDLICVVAPNGTLVSASPAVTSMLGYTPSELTGRPLDLIVDHDALGTVHDLLAEAADREGEAREREVALCHAEGGRVLVVITCVAPGDGWNGYLVLNVHDVSRQRSLESQLRHDARHDTLTGLLNRKAFSEISERVCDEAAAAGTAVGMLYIDLDGFKDINDSYGHDAGDRVLREVARRIGRCLAPAETLARLGGDEFAVVIADAHQDRPAHLADRILESLTAPIGGFPTEVHIGASIGLALRNAEGIEMSTLLHAADAAMYTAKRAGRRRWVMDGTIDARDVGPDAAPASSI